MKTNRNNKNGHLARRAGVSRQGGVVLVLFAVGMLAILAMVGLALDGSHLMLSKTRLQNSVDAAALAAAKVLDQSNGDENQARAAALAMLNLNTGLPGHKDLAKAFGSSNVQVTVEFANASNPFVPGTIPAQYVRVRALNMQLWAGLIGVLGIENKAVSASAVAGISPTINQLCNLMPIVVCGVPASQGGTPPYWGFQESQVKVLKWAASGSQSPVGPGNFQLLRLGGSGANVVRENLAGGYDSCLTGDTVETQPGNQTGPVAQGINTRMNDFQGPLNGMQTTYPPDVITRSPTPALTYEDSTQTVKSGNQTVTQGSDLDNSFNHAEYDRRLKNGQYDLQPQPNGPAQFNRRELPIVIGDCTGSSNNGQSTLKVLGVGCFFMLQPVVQKGNEAQLFGEFLKECPAQGTPGPFPNSGPGPYTIQLYKDTGSKDS